MRRLTVLIIIMLSSTAAGLHAQTNWTLDKSHTVIRFTVDHLMISEVEGTFKEFDGSVVSTNDDFSDAEVTFTAKVGSLSTDQERRDNHLKSDDFFNVEEYPELKFVGNIVLEGGKHFLVGDFTIRDNTKKVKFDVKYNGTIPARNGRKAGFKVTGTIDRFDYGVKWDRAMETGGLVVGKDVQITCNIELNEVTSSN